MPMTFARSSMSGWPQGPQVSRLPSQPAPTRTPASFSRMIDGTVADVEVPSVTGNVSLRIPPGTQSGQMFNLRGRGLPRVNASGVGDLHVRVQLWTPETVSREEEALIRKLAEMQQAPKSREKGFWTRMKEALGA